MFLIASPSSKTRAAAEDLYLSVFTRMPTDAERADVEKYLKDRTRQTSSRTRTCLGSAELGGISI
jgi:hypothetical protein